MPSFLLPCECGHKLEVTAAQAGQRLTCVCGRTVDVPTLRGLQSLERTRDDEGSRAPAPRRWGARQGLLFLGTLLAVVSLIAAVGLELARPKGVFVAQRFVLNVGPHDPVLQNSIVPLDKFQSLSPADVWLTWQITTPVGADRSVSMNGAIANRSAGPWSINWPDARRLVWIIGGFGVALIAVSLLIPAKSARRPIARNRAGSPS